MVCLLFNLLMLALALASRIRSPQVLGLRGLWFFATLPAMELPWLFAALQVIVTLALTLLVNPGCPGWAVYTILALSLWQWLALHRLSLLARQPLEHVIRELADCGPRTGECEQPQGLTPLVRNWLRPLSFRRPGVARIADLRYGELSRQTLDIYRPGGTPASPMPILLHIHGGGWVVGHKHQQGQPLLWHMAQRGWLCVDINYRLAPKQRFPACIIDVKTAISWLKAHAREFSANPDFIAITGGSAGGHLCALAALTANDPQYQPGFEQADTTVQAAVPMYGVYDITRSLDHRAGSTMVRLMARFVMPVPLARDTKLWQQASPKYRIHRHAPPMLLIHGSHDAMVPVEDARDFAKHLSANSCAHVFYAELAGAQHAFDVFHSVRTEYAVAAIDQFLNWCYRHRRL